MTQHHHLDRVGGITAHEQVEQLKNEPHDRVLLISLAPTAAAFAAPAAGAPMILAVNDLHGVIDGLRTWIIGLLAALATLFFVVGGVRYMTAGGDPSEIERAKAAFKAAALGYALAVLAPVLLSALQSILGV